MAQENCRILQELAELRAQKSALLGFETHAAFALEMNMAKDCKTVATFLGKAARELGKGWTAPAGSCPLPVGSCQKKEDSLGRG